jgi:hypothetical protein
MVDRSPKVVCLSVNFHEDLVQMPLPIGMSVLPSDTFLAEFSCENRTEPIPPKPNRLVTDIDAALVQQVFNISKRERETHVHHHCQVDDFRRRLEVAKGRGFCHPQTLRNRPALFKSVSSDTAGPTADRRPHRNIPIFLLSPLKFFVRSGNFFRIFHPEILETQTPRFEVIFRFRKVNVTTAFNEWFEIVAAYLGLRQHIPFI